MRPITSRRQAFTPRSSTATQPRVDGVLISLGCPPAFITDLLGDLRQEYTERVACDGRFAARLWYAREMLRSTPHLAWSAVRGGTPATRMRLAACCLAGIATLSLATIAWVTRNGPPARLVNGAASSNGIVVNHVGPVQFSTTVLDAAGHRLRRDDVRYQRVSGIEIPVSSRGVAKCTERGDALVRATLGALKTDFRIHCEPVRKVRFAGWGNFLVGDSARTLTVDAVGLDGQPVTRIAAKLIVLDSTVATLDGSLLRPLRPGWTRVEMDIGDQTFDAMVTVFERLPSLPELRPDQGWVAVPVHLERGEWIRWPLPTGLFFLAFSTDTSDLPVPKGWARSQTAHPNVRLSVDGPIMCMPEPASGASNTHCLARGPGATLTIRHIGRGPAEVVGMLALERQEKR
jgi:hypothetical protein